MKWTAIAVCLAIFGLAEGRKKIINNEKYMECLPGSQWKNPCQDCACSEDAKAVCQESPCKDGDTSPVNLETDYGKCAVGTRWNTGCNSCFCGGQEGKGIALCTAALCYKIEEVDSTEDNTEHTVDTNLDATRTRRDTDTKAPAVRIRQNVGCLTGSQWSTPCKDCVCSENGRASCREKPCKASEAESQPGLCAPNTSWKNDCNTCHCSENGLPLCTKIGCIHLDTLEVQESAECLAGTVWESNCHRCECSQNGIAVCARTPCADVKTVLPEPIRCKPNTTFARSCNSCVCLDDGTALCTAKQCPGQTITPVPVPTTEEPELPEGQECAPGTMWKNKCNGCSCTPDGLPTCTQMDCKDDSGPAYRCKPDSRWRDDCNTCFCNFDGVPVCTRIGCGGGGHKIPPGTIFGSKGSEGSAKSNVLQNIVKRQAPPCNPGERIYRDCNECTCDKNGSYICTKRACVNRLPPDVAALQKRAKREPERVCEPEEQFKQDCNTCWCNGDGTRYWCTKIGCQHVVPPDQASVAQVYNDRLKREACTPHDLFQQDCNTCKCNTDGASYTCTQNECMDKIGDVEVFMENEGTDHIERNSVCQPSSAFSINCNDCHCNDDGTDYRCTNKVCPLPEDVELFRELKDESHIVPLKKCDPNGIFYDGCKECRCNENGSDYNCMKTECKGHQSSGFRDEEAKSALNKTIVCQANKAFQKDCNTCWCNEDGTGYFCTRKVCVPNLPDEAESTERPEELRIIEKECRPHEVFEIECNMCRCNEDGKSFSCTRRACVTDSSPDSVDYEAKSSDNGATAAPAGARRVKRDEQAKPVVKACEPGSKFRVDCNTCLCHTDGQAFACTRNDCHPQPEQSAASSSRRRRREVGKQDVQDCEPGSVFSQDCNVCRCTSDGQHATCTLKRCKNVSPDDKKNQPETETGFRCTPGEQFKRACNDCTCSADGKSVFCTIKLCEKEIASQL